MISDGSSPHRLTYSAKVQYQPLSPLPCSSLDLRPLNSIWKSLMRVKPRTTENITSPRTTSSVEKKLWSLRLFRNGTSKAQLCKKLGVKRYGPFKILDFIENNDTRV